MYQTSKTDRFVVYDDVLDEKELPIVQNYVASEKYASPNASGEWKKVWRLNDANCMGGPAYWHSSGVKAFPLGMQIAYHYISKLAEENKDLIGEWKDISIRPFLYPRNTKLSWHNDIGYKAAAIIYVHPYWGSTWGGELMIAHVPDEDPSSPPWVSHRVEDKFMEHFGIGQYITAKPNRFVLTTSNVWHQVNRVDVDAGDNLRQTIVAFFHEKTQEEQKD